MLHNVYSRFNTINRIAICIQVLLLDIAILKANFYSRGRGLLAVKVLKSGIKSVHVATTEKTTSITY